MQLKRIYNLAGLNKGDKIALCSANEGIENSIGYNMNLTTGFVVENNGTSVLITTNDKKDIVLTDFIIRMQSVYLIEKTEEKIDIKPKLSLVNLERKLRNAERAKRRYKAILKQRFNVTDEDLKNNFKEAKKTNTDKNFFTYKSLDIELPYLLHGQLIHIPATCRFKKAFINNNTIQCVINAYDNNGNQIAKATGLATCHPDDAFKEELGELISSTKALNAITSKLY